MTAGDDKPKPLHGRSEELWDALRNSGIIREGDSVRRVIIDIDAGKRVIIYTERYADTRTLELLPVIGHGRAEIRRADKIPETVAEAEQI